MLSNSWRFCCLRLAAPSRLSAWPAEGASRAAAAPAAGARASSEPTAGTWPAGEPAAGRRCDRHHRNGHRAHRFRYRRAGRAGSARQEHPRGGSLGGSASFLATDADRPVHHRRQGGAGHRRERGAVLLHRAGRRGAPAAAACLSSHPRRTGCCRAGDRSGDGPFRCFRSRMGCCPDGGRRAEAPLAVGRPVPASRPTDAAAAAGRSGIGVGLGADVGISGAGATGCGSGSSIGVGAGDEAVPAGTFLAAVFAAALAGAAFLRRRSYRLRLRMLPSIFGRPAPRLSMTPIGRTHRGRPTSPGRPCSQLRTPWRARIPGP